MRDFVHFILGVDGCLVLIVAVILNKTLQATFVGRALLYLDMFACALFLRDADMTISARCGLALRHGRGGLLSGLGRVLNLIQTNHCETAIADDIERAKRAISYLTGLDPVGPYDDCQ